MKLHLPERLFRAVMLLMSATPAALYAAYTAPTEIIIPETYTNSEDLSGNAGIAEESESTVYRLTDDVSMSPSGASFATVSYLYTSDSAEKLASLTFTKPGGSTKSAFSVNSSLTFDSLNEISFTSFTPTSFFGGAMSVYASGNLVFSNNAKVQYENNKLNSSSNAASGGGLYLEGSAAFSNNAEVTFSGNTAKSQGGAIAVSNRAVSTEYDLKVIGNDTVKFTGNNTNNQMAGLGGAVYNMMGAVTMTHNGNLSFSGNTAKATYMSQGGAIYSSANGGDGLKLNLSYNDSLSFTNNLSQSGGYNAPDGNAYGGAILASGTDVILNTNGSLHFSGNKAYTTNSSWVAQGGAIRVGYVGSLSLQNNGSVVFEDNKTQVGSTVKYNSIYADDSAVSVNGTVNTYKLNVKISAPEDGSVEFRDCVYIDVSQHEGSSFDLNSKYTDEEGKEIAQTGDIIFTGAYMTSGDKTSVFKGTASLHDGSLIVKEGAVLQTDTLSINSSVSGTSTPVLEISAAKLTAESLTFGKGTLLVYNGVDNESDAMITVSKSLAMSESVVLGLSGAYSGDTLKVAVACYTGSSENWLTLPTSTNFTVSSLLWDASNLGWVVEDGVAYVTGTTTQKDVVNISGEEIIVDSADALNTDIPIVNVGSATISTAGDVTANLSGTMQNSGELTLNGKFDVSNMRPAGVSEADTRVCVDGKEGLNGFFRDGDTVITVVDNGDQGTLIVGDDTVITKDGVELHLAESGKAGELDYSNYHIEEGDHSAAMSEIQGMSDNQTATITMTEGTLVADAHAENVQSTGGTIETMGDVTIGDGADSEIGGDTSVKVGAGNATLAGDNSYTGDTTISGADAKLILGSDKALGKSTVKLDSHATLDLNGMKVDNDIDVTGCELHNASNYTGNLTVSASATSTGELDICGQDPIARANKVTLKDTGRIYSTAGVALEVNSFEMAADATGDIDTNLTTTAGGNVILNEGTQLVVGGVLTLGKGTTFVLKGADWAKDDTLATAADGVNETTGRVILDFGYASYLAEGNMVILTAIFDQSIAEAFTVSNWGIASASRTFVNAVRGQRTNTGCIANGRGTAWAAVLGGTSDIGNGDIDLKGAAVGADMKVGEKSSVGVAVGYIDGDARIPGLSKAEQEGTYMALYGEHGLKKLSPTSCLSLDWVAAYGQTETEWESADWEQQSLQLNTRLNWNKKLTDRLSMSVFGGLEYFTSESDRVENARTGSIQNLRGEIGVGARYVAWGTPGTVASYDEKGALVTASRPGCEKLVLHGEIRYMNDMVRSNPVIEQDGLRGDGENPGRQGMGIEAGATYRIGERWSASANYSFNALDDSREHRVNVGASYTF